MKINSRFALASVVSAVAFAVSPAFAADVVYQEPPAPAPVFEPAPVATWAGPYAGIQLGYGFSGSVERPGNDIGTDGFLGGVFGGYNFQNGQFVYGLEGDVNYSDVHGTDAGEAARSRFEGSIRARVGMAVTDDVLVYGTFGGAAEKQRVVVDGVRDSNTMLGYTVGAGVDARLTEKVFARAEYRFTDYDDEKFDFGAGAVPYDSSNHRVTLGVGFKF